MPTSRPHRNRPTVRAAASAVSLIAAVATIGACGSSDDATTRPTTRVVTVTTSATTEPGSPTSTAGAVRDPAPDDTDEQTTPIAGPDVRSCGPVPDAAARIADASARIAPPSQTLPYEWSTIRSDMSTCNQLSWAELTTKGGTASSADQLLLFGPDGRWLGTGIRCTVGLASVRGSGPDHVDVGYAYRRSPTEGTADASGLAVIRFRWNGSEVVMEGDLPDALVRDQCSGQR